MNGKRQNSKPKKYPSSLLGDIELVYCHRLLYMNGLCTERANPATVKRLTQRLISIPVIAKQRGSGHTVGYILQHLSPRTMQRIRKQLSRVRQ
jgi:hypothetical protein